MELKKIVHDFFAGLKRRLLPPVVKHRVLQKVSADLVLVVTKRCNLKCRTCLRGEKDARDIDMDLLDGFFDDARKLGFGLVSLTGGEPILYPRFGELIEKIVSRGFLVGLVTNGLRYKDYLKALGPYKDKVRFIAVSLDSHLREVNDSVRGEGVFDKALEALRAFAAEGYPIRVSHIVNKENRGRVEDFVKFIRGEVRPELINIGSAIRTPYNSAVVLDAGEKESLRPVLGRLKARYPEVNILSSTGYFSGLLLYCSQFSGFFELTVNTDGDAIFCCDNALDGAVMGNIRNKTLAELAARFFEMQGEVKSALVRKRLEGERGLRDCDLCNRILGKYIKGSGRIQG